MLPEIYASSPYDGKILEYDQGVLHQCISFCMHFIKQLHWNWKLMILKRGLKKNQFIEGCDSTSWQNILNLAGLENIAQIDAALRTMIGGIQQ